MIIKRTTNNFFSNSDTDIVLVSGDQKQKRLMEAYSRIAEDYDRIVDIVNLGQRLKFKRVFIERIAPKTDVKLIDVASGTGDIPHLFFEYQGKNNNDTRSTVHVVDINPEMLAVGRKRFENTEWGVDGRITYEIANAENLQTILDNTYDIYTISGGIHNVPHPALVMKEAYRILKPGGIFACIDFGHIESPIHSWFASFCRSLIFPIIFRIFSYDHNAFNTIADSAYKNFHQRELANLARHTGFILPENVYENLNHGIMSIIIGTKPLAPE